MIDYNKWEHEEYVFNGITAPGHTIHSLIRYARDKVPTGGFLQAVLCNDLMGACGKADLSNLKTLPAIAAFVYNQLPVECWGNKDKIREWLKK
jgi:hypothetical protein